MSHTASVQQHHGYPRPPYARLTSSTVCHTLFMDYGCILSHRAANSKELKKQQGYPVFARSCPRRFCVSFGGAGGGGRYALMRFLTTSSQVIKMDDCIGAAVEERISSMGNGEVMLLENVRFHPGEEVRETEFLGFAGCLRYLWGRFLLDVEPSLSTVFSPVHHAVLKKSQPLWTCDTSKACSHESVYLSAAALGAFVLLFCRALACRVCCNGMSTHEKCTLASEGRRFP